MDAERVTIDVAGHVADVRMVRGDKHNGLDWRMFVALNEALDELSGAEGVRCVVLSGDGPSFCAGLDFKSFAEGNGDLAGDGFAAVDGSIANYAQRVAYGWRELEVPVIAVSQLSRAPEQRSDTHKRPILSDLRESGQIEQDADLVMFIYREEYYNRETERQGIADIIVAKHRNGPVDDVEMTFLSRYPKFANIARGGNGPPVGQVLGEAAVGGEALE